MQHGWRFYPLADFPDRGVIVSPSSKPAAAAFFTREEAKALADQSRLEVETATPPALNPVGDGGDVLQAASPPKIKRQTRRNTDEPSARICPPPAAHPSPAELADRLEALARDMGCGVSRIATHVLGRTSGVADLRKKRRAMQPQVIARILAFLSDPPPLEEIAKRPYTPKPVNRRNVESMRRNTAKAQELLDSGKSSSEISSVSLRITARKIEVQRAEEARLANPVEQAKTRLRRRYSPVVDAEVCNGPRGHFYVGRKLVNEEQLFAMARELAA